jgi:pimeloyl-ACP methyl ester carboxylesterase
MILPYKNIPIFYEDEGDGEPVVLLHGFLENAKMWDQLKPIILKNHRVICVDLLGHGQTGCLGYIHTMKDMADAVLAVLNHLNIKLYTVIGHSMGGYVALALAESYPKKIKRLCLMNSNYIADDEELSEKRKKANIMVQTNFENVVRLSFTNLFSPESRITHKEEMEAALQDALYTTVQGYMAGQEGMRVRENKFEFFKQLDAKKLIIVGKKDLLIDRERILEEIKDTDILYEELPYGHMSHIENKSEISYIINCFVE